MKAHSMPLWRAGSLLVFPLLALAQPESGGFDGLLFEAADPAGPAPRATAAERAEPGAGPAQAAPQPPPVGLPPGFSLREGPDRFTETLLEQDSVTGPYALELEEQLQALGRSYEQSGDYERAVETLESALHVARVNYGLFALEQESLVRDIIRNQMARGETAEAERWRSYLYYLGVKNHPPGDPALYRAKLDFADWNVDAYYRGIPAPQTRVQEDSLFKEAVPTEIVRLSGPNSTSRYIGQRGDRGLGDLVSESALRASITSGRRIDFELNPRLRTAVDLYSEVAEELERAEDMPDAFLREASLKLANSAFIVKQGFDAMVSDSFAGTLYGRLALQELYRNPVVANGYEQGRDALEGLRRRARAGEDAEAARAFARATLDLADWDLSYDRAGSARALYRDAWETLEEAGFGEAEIAALVAPRPLVEIPAFGTHFFSRRLLGVDEDAGPAWRGFVNLEVDVDRDGNLTRISPISVSAGTSIDIVGALLGRLDMARVRPGLEGGEAVAREGLRVRYYYAFVDTP